MEKEICDKFATICHYTKYDTVKKILKNKNIRATYYKELNDSSEVEYAKNIIIDYLEKNPPHLCGKLIEDDYRSVVGDVYITSFTKNNTELGLIENDGILSMWRYYGKDGGCCIEFGTNKIFESYKKHIHLDQTMPQALVFDEVLYNTKNYKNKISLKLRAFYDALVKKNLNNVFLNDYANKFTELLCLLKYQAFFEENEIRAVLYLNPPNHPKTQNSIQSKCPTHEYIEVFFDVSSISKIIVGPQNNQKVKIDDLKKYLNQEGYNNIEVACSEIPFKNLLK